MLLTQVSKQVGRIFMPPYPVSASRSCSRQADQARGEPSENTTKQATNRPRHRKSKPRRHEKEKEKEKESDQNQPQLVLMGYSRFSTFRDADRFFKHSQPKPNSISRALRKDLTGSVGWRAVFSNFEDLSAAKRSLELQHGNRTRLTTIAQNKYATNSEDKDNWLIITGVPVSVTNDTLRRQLDLRDDSLFLERIKRLVDSKGRQVEAVIACTPSEEAMSLITMLKHKATIDFGRSGVREISVMPLS